MPPLLTMRKRNLSDRIRDDSAFQGRGSSEEGKQPVENLLGARRATANMQIDWDGGSDAANAGIAAGEHAAIERAVAHGDDPFGIGGRAIGPFERLAHVPRNRASDEEHVGMTGR